MYMHVATVDMIAHALSACSDATLLPLFTQVLVCESHHTGRLLSTLYSSGGAPNNDSSLTAQTPPACPLWRPTTERWYGLVDRGHMLWGGGVSKTTNWLSATQETMWPSKVSQVL